ncbi:MAG: glycosyltransferase [Solirubrobacterales bacterium]|nr:glycosyltransferase [Solirubrobacterales bacterium]
MPSASVIVASRGPASRLRRLLDSLAIQTSSHEALVVDNASRNGAVGSVCSDYAFAESIRLERNAGFSVPVNLAASRASGDALVLINDDCVCDPDFVERVVAALDPAAGVVMASSVMRDVAEPDLIDSAGMELDRTLLVYDYMNGVPVADLADGPPDPIGPSAAAAAFDRAAFMEVGGFDERIFAYWEDVDLVLRLRRAGGSCRLARDAGGTHEHSATLGSGSAAKNYLTGYGRGYVLRKWGVLSSPGRIASVAARELVIVGGQAVIDHTASGLRGRVRGWLAARPYAPFPADLAAAGGGSPFFRNLARRLGRRRRLASRGNLTPS